MVHIDSTQQNSTLSWFHVFSSLGIVRANYRIARLQRFRFEDFHSTIKMLSNEYLPSLNQSNQSKESISSGSTNEIIITVKWKVWFGS
jgi:hypothetical protein